MNDAADIPAEKELFSGYVGALGAGGGKVYFVVGTPRYVSALGSPICRILKINRSSGSYGKEAREA